MNSSPLLSPAFCSANGIIIIEVAPESISFGLLNDDNQALKARIEKTFPKYQCYFNSISQEEFNLQLAQLYADDHGENNIVQQKPSGDSLVSAIDQVADDAPVINLLNSIFLEAISKKASDIHIESEKGDVHLRFRIDGILLPIRTIAHERAVGISARLKLLAHLNILETRRPQDGHIDIKSETYSVDVRISITPTIWGESIVLRLLNRSDIHFSLDTLGFSLGQRKQLDSLLGLSSGLVLVTGPTGSGKTTTLAALLKMLNTPERKIISLEDPVEYRIPGITQIQINEELGLTFDALLRRLFRQDPDIIMVGEIRDSETADLAIRAALTGHVVFATLHTTDAVEAIYRLQNIGIPAYMVAAVLRAVIAQRLVRRICMSCDAVGCPQCSSTGYSGRTVISEIITITRETAEHIGEGMPSGKLRQTLEKGGHKNLAEDAKEKVGEGITTDEEIQRELGIGEAELKRT